MIKIVKVSGNSMYPDYKEGDYIIALSFFKKFFLKPNQSILFQHKEFGLLIKNIKVINFNNSTFTTFGSNSSDTLSSEKMGVIMFKQIIGKPILKFSAS